MFIKCRRFICSILLLLPFSTPAIAQVIHWELSSPVTNQISGGFITGGFDFSLETGAISNITVQTDADFNDPLTCFPCNNFAGGEGTFNEGSRPSVVFTEELGDVRGQEFSLAVSNLDLTTPGTFSDLDLFITGYLLLINDPSGDPDVFASEGCVGCVSATGRLLTNPIPEPETYAMLLAGLGLLGLVARRRRCI